MTKAKKYWKGLAELNNNPLVEKLKQNEFVENKNKKIRSQWDTYDYFCKINT